MLLEEEIRKLYDSLQDVKYEGHAGQIDNVLNAIVTGAPVLIDGQSGRNTLELILGINKSASTGEKVTFPLTVDDSFYRREGIQSNATHFYEKKVSVENFQDLSIATGSSLDV